eukprot:m.190864 g.190864  ORF g.190864 m.190864 type:complete len:65 (+) comp15137_c0_seq1:1501-1695(+)
MTADPDGSTPNSQAPIARSARVASTVATSTPSQPQCALCLRMVQCYTMLAPRVPAPTWAGGNHC